MNRGPVILGVLAALAAGCGFRIELADPDAAPGLADASGLADGAAGGGDAGVVTPDAPAGDCITTQVKASKSYGLVPITLDGLLFQDSTYPRLVIPASLPVTAGNAGNGCAYIVMSRASDGAFVRCRYRGGADVAHVGTDLAQVAKGLTYVFDACTRGQACPTLGSPVEASLVAGSQLATAAGALLRIDRGDDQAGTTEITEPFQRCR